MNSSETESWEARRDRAVEGLRKAIRAAPVTLRETIATFDSQCMPSDFPKHREALDRLIEDYDCVLNRMPNSSWFPGEPIELASYGADGQGAITTAYACCFLLIDDLCGGKMMYMEFRLTDSPGRTFFDTPPDRFRLPLLEGISVYDEMAVRDGYRF